ncbi:uncharacterized protein LOC8061743 [Sorghum bicolor]|uniref:uncharacterized protein LOC8061743 n=1 Tax=Sorghum bicolor TaxID=4558 RepID=UPI000B424969|nr:uncharacterized protein LOC8061743 [Sorghum bicolor]|eukprot:XP_021303850.1 uncharacterized protein LOC8061743 [Sorghum bicolor]
MDVGWRRLRNAPAKFTALRKPSCSCSCRQAAREEERRRKRRTRRERERQQRGSTAQLLRRALYRILAVAALPPRAPDLFLKEADPTRYGTWPLPTASAHFLLILQLKRVKHGHFFGATFLSSCLSRRGSASSPLPFLPHPRFPPICSNHLFSPFLSRRPSATNAHLGRAPIPSLVASAVATAATRVPVAVSAQTLLHAPQPLRAHRLSHQDLDTVDYIVGRGGIPEGTKEISKDKYFGLAWAGGCWVLGLPQMPQQPGEPQVNGMHPPSTAGVNWFLLPVSECKCAHGTLLDELQPYASGGREP